MQPSCILTVNGGSSSIRCAIYERGDEPRFLTRIKIDGIGKRDAVLGITAAESSPVSRSINATSIEDAINAIVTALASFDLTRVTAIGHRIVHGMQHTQPQLIDPKLFNELQQLHSLDPEHLPVELQLVKAFGQRFNGVPQIACFDTAFHRSIPDVARTLPLPAAYREAGIERYGFHGLSYQSLTQQLAAIDSVTAHTGRVVLAHLGNGASLAAVRNGQCVDTTMSFTPASGIMMSTRSGDLDPGVLYYLCRSRNISMDELQHALNHQSGMLGVSSISGDIRILLEREKSNSYAALALDMFCYQVRKCIGAYAAAMGGIDALIFSGGIGENSAVIRARICEGLEFFGIRIDAELNDSNHVIISSRQSIPVCVIRTDEELMIARLVMQCQPH